MYINNFETINRGGEISFEGEVIKKNRYIFFASSNVNEAITENVKMKYSFFIG